MLRFRRAVFVAMGTFSLALGVAGVFVPLLPATPFLLFSAFCFARSSERFHRWLLGHRWLGGYIRAYREGRGMARRDKAATIVLLWASIGLTAGLAVASWWARGLLLAVAVGVTIHILCLKTAAPRSAAQRTAPSRGGTEIEMESD